MHVSLLLAVLTVGNPSGDAVVESARRYLGYPYVFGGEGERGFDCSGFVRRVFHEHGYNLPRTSRAQAQLGKDVAWNALEPGDLLFFSATPRGTRINHVAIATGDAYMVHASTGRREVVIDPISMPYYQERRMAARRIIHLRPEAISQADTDGESEHGEESVFAASASTGPIRWHHGPLTLSQEITSVGLRLLAARMQGTRFLLASPQATLQVESWDTEIGIQFPVAANVAPWQAAWTYRRPLDYLRILNHARLGIPESQVYVEASRELSATLGEGFLVANTTPAVVTRNLPNVPIHAPFAMAAALTMRAVRVQFVADDIVAPAVIGAGVRVGEHSKVGLSAVADPSAPASGAAEAAMTTRLRVASALDAQFPIWQGKLLNAALDGALGLLNSQPRASLGVQGGATLHIQHNAWDVQARGALRTHQAGFVPALFGLDYRRQRLLGPLGAPIWETLDQAPHAIWRIGWSAGTEVTYTRRFGLRLSYEGANRTDAITGIVPINHFELGVLARDIFISAIKGWISFHLTYHQRFFDAVKAPLGSAARSEYIFGGLRLRQGKYFEAGVHAAKRVTLSHPGITPAWEGYVDGAFRLPL